MYLLAIDPGPTQSAYVIYDIHTEMPKAWAKVPNGDILDLIQNTGHRPLTGMVVEQIQSYGKPVGAEVFTTVLWSGRFIQAWWTKTGTNARLLPRRHVKLHLCGAANAKDAHVRQRLIDLYGPGKDVAVGLKAKPGPLYGFKADCWQALGLAITAAETADSCLHPELREPKHDSEAEDGGLQCLPAK